MLGRRAGESPNAMIDVTYRQNPAEREVVAVLQRLYLCASVEFLMAVADFFVKALPQGPAQLPVAAHGDKLPFKQLSEQRVTAHTQNGNVTLMVVRRPDDWWMYLNPSILPSIDLFLTIHLYQ